jgi:molecular chaperone HtpG
MTTMLEQETHAFKAQTRDLLAIVIHSLYTQKEIFLRELISNASDALDRLRFDALIAPSLMPDGYSPLITLEADATLRTLTIADNGIGMKREEVVDNLGTIARSGTKELMEGLRARGQEGIPELIGRFGVGFYSAFMVADRVTVTSRHASESDATRWESSGDGEYTVADAERAVSGTTIVLSLKAVDNDAGIEDYTDPWILSRIVKRYSDFVAYPIVLKNAPVEDGFTPEVSCTPAKVEDKTLNSQKPVWAKPGSEVTDEAYREYYRHLTHDWHPPLLRLSARAEGRIECQALLFIPSEAPTDLYYHAAPYGLQLYAKRVMVIDQCPDLLPRHLRFVRGVVDVLDLPLHISRQMLQERWQIERIQKWVTRKVLDLLAETQQREPAAYLTFWKQFGRALKEGLGADHENRERLLSLFLFESSHHESELTTLDAYVARMKPDQQEIYYLSGESREAIEHAPHLEAVRAHGFEVLYLTDPVDDILVQALPEHAGKRVKGLDKGTLQMNAPAAADDDGPPPEAGDFATLTDRLGTLLSAHVKSVRLSARLTTSPVCLAGEEYDYSPRMERLLLKGKGGGPRQRRILELNGRHPLIVRLNEQSRAVGEPAIAWADCAELLLGYALLAEGSEPVNAVRFGHALASLMQHGL